MSDIYGDQTVLLLHSEGTDGSTQFLDSAYRNIVAANGNARISTAQKKFGSSSAYFDGVGDYLSLPASDKFTFGADDFTIEGMFEFNDVTLPRMLVDFRTINTTTQMPVIYVLSGMLRFFDGSDRITTAVSIGQWYHVAVTRSAGFIYMFVNGVIAGTYAVSTTSYSSSATGPKIGSLGGTTDFFYGYIDEFRITKGVARYTENFTPPTAPFDDPTIFKADDSPLYWAETKLLLHMDGANGSTYFRDEKHSPITVGGDAKLSTTQPMLGSSSGHFDGVGDCVYAPSAKTNVSFDLPGDFTIEMLVKPEGTFSIQRPILNTYASNWSLLWCYFDILTTGILEVAIGAYRSILLRSDAALSAGQVYHLAVARSGAITKLFINGVPQSLTSTSTVGVLTSGMHATGFVLGRNPYVDSYYQGYIDEVRVTVGVARYTDRFVPPTKAFPDLKQYDPHWNSVVLAMPMDKATAIECAVDLKGNSIFSFQGATNLRPDMSKFKGMCCRWEGNSAQLRSPINASTNLYDGTSFTLEFWIRMDSTTGITGIIGSAGWSGGVGFGFVQNAGTCVMQMGDLQRTFANPLVAGQWHHMVLVGQGGVPGATYAAGSVKVYLDGNIKFISADPVSAVAVQGTLAIGNDPYSEGFGSPVDFCMCQLRITKGVTRYTTNFTPPTEPFPTTVPESLSGVVHDSSGNPIQRTVRSYRRDTGALIGTAVSDPVTGLFSLPADTTDEHFVIIFDDVKNALIYDHITPVAA